MRYEALKERIVINGLPIMNDRPNPVRLPERDRPRQAITCTASPAGRAPSSRWPRNFEDFPRAVRKKLLQEVADIGPRGSDFDIGARAAARRHAARARRAGRRVRGDDDYTKFVRPEYELGCDVGERRSREFWQRRFGVTPD